MHSACSPFHAAFDDGVSWDALGTAWSVSGWAFATTGEAFSLELEIGAERHPIVLELPRPDVAAAHGERAATSGFSATIRVARGTHRVRLLALGASGTDVLLEHE